MCQALFIILGNPHKDRAADAQSGLSSKLDSFDGLSPAFSGIAYLSKSAQKFFCNNR